MKKLLLFLVTHAIAGLVGFVAGAYYLPILIAPPAPTQAEILRVGDTAPFTGEFVRDLPGSDALHWGQGAVFVSNRAVAMQGKLAPGPDYKLYLAPEFVDNKADFVRLKNTMTRIGDIDTFENFIVTLPTGTDVKDYNTVVVWCEAFERFITAAQYR